MPDKEELEKILKEREKEFVYTLQNIDAINFVNYMAQADCADKKLGDITYSVVNNKAGLKTIATTDDLFTTKNVFNEYRDAKNMNTYELNESLDADNTLSDNVDTQTVNDEANDNASLDDLVNERFSEQIANDLTESQKFIDEMKKKHSKDYDKYVEKLRNTRAYKKAYEKWSKYYADLKEKCANEVKNEIELSAKGNAFDDTSAKVGDNNLKNDELNGAAVKNVAATKQAEKSENLEMLKNRPATEEKNASNKDNDNALPKRDEDNAVAKTDEIAANELKKPTVTPTTAEIDVSNYTPLASDGKMKVDERLKKTVQDILLDALYKSFDDMSSYYYKLKSGSDEAKKDYELIAFRKQISNDLQELNNIIVPKSSKPRMPGVKAMQYNVKNHKDNPDIDAILALYLDSLYHIDTKTSEVTGVIPVLANEIASQLQDILLANGVLDFNITKPAARSLLNEVVKRSNLGNEFIESLPKDNGLVTLSNYFTDEIKKIKEGKLIFKDMARGYHNLVDRYKAVNPIDAEKYDELKKVVDCLDVVTKKLSESNVALAKCKDAEVKSAMRSAKSITRNVKSDAKVIDALNNSSDEILLKKTDKTKILFDCLTNEFIKSATDLYRNDRLSELGYLQKKVTNDAEKITKRLQGKNINKNITSNLIDSITVATQAWQLDENLSDEMNKKVDSFITELTKTAIALEEDELAEKRGNLTSEQLEAKQKNQKYAQVLIADYTKIVNRKSNKKNKIDVKSMEFNYGQ